MPPGARDERGAMRDEKVENYKGLQVTMIFGCSIHWQVLAEPASQEQDVHPYVNFEENYCPSWTITSEGLPSYRAGSDLERKSHERSALKREPTSSTGETPPTYYSGSQKSRQSDSAV